MEETEVDPKVEIEVHFKKANNALTIAKDLSHARRKSALSARRKDASLQITQTRSVKLHARSSSLHVTL